MMRDAAIKTALVAATLLLLATLASRAQMPPDQFLGNLLFGCVMFLVRVSSKVTINWSAVATGLTCLLFIWAGSHYFLRWLASAMQAGNAAGASPSPALPCWKPRWTTALVGVVVLMFVAGISFIGLVHQTAWLATSPQPYVEERVERRRFGSSKEHILYLGMGVRNYHDILQALPPRRRDIKGKHSWMTAIMPFSPLIVDTIDMDLDWDDPKNKPSFARVVPTYLNPEIAPFRNADGYAVSHYAGNVHVLGNDRVVNEAHITDGTSNTLLAGEVAANFKPWGDPANLRDLATGLCNHPDSFGGPSGDGALLLTMDGSVRSFSKNTSPAVLKALSRPNDGLLPPR
jgi:hypothetical protein